MSSTPNKNEEVDLAEVKKALATGGAGNARESAAVSSGAYTTTDFYFQSH